MIRKPALFLSCQLLGSNPEWSNHIDNDKSASAHEPVRSNGYDPFGMSLDENRVSMRVPVTIKHEKQAAGS
jgi:hypothetical protein